MRLQAGAVIATIARTAIAAITAFDADAAMILAGSAG
jgi:hypothetical protein